MPLSKIIGVTGISSGIGARLDVKEPAVPSGSFIRTDVAPIDDRLDASLEASVLGL